MLLIVAKLKVWEVSAAGFGLTFAAVFLFSNASGMGVAVLAADLLWVLTRVEIVGDHDGRAAHDRAGAAWSDEAGPPDDYEAFHSLQGRALVVGQRKRVEFFGSYRSTVPALTREVAIPRDKLLVERHAGAVRMARDFFLRFGWKPPLSKSSTISVN